jgi:NTP pyrophosphatase (non-canonical NTP hydrolase)
MLRSIKRWQEEIHKLSRSKGWYDTKVTIPISLLNLHGEISEALEAYRVKNDDLMAEELADIAIRLMDMCEFLDIDLEYQISRKHEINKGRPYRHGGKRC